MGLLWSYTVSRATSVRCCGEKSPLPTEICAVIDVAVVGRLQAIFQKECDTRFFALALPDGIGDSSS
jgi:hypothetical protein